MRKLSALLLFLLFFPCCIHSACTPVAAVLRAISDDNMEMWINGTYIGKITTNTDVVGTLPIDPALIMQTGNIIRVRNNDNAASNVFTSWIIDVTCSDGSHSYINHTENSPKAFYCGTCWDSACTVPVDGSGREWWNPAWVNPNPGTYFVNPGVLIPISPFLTRLTNPYTGAALDPISFNAAAGPDSGNGCIFFSYSATLGPQMTMTPTPSPTVTRTPVINMTKSSSTATAYVGDTITFSISYTNVGPMAANNFFVWDSVPAVVSVISVLDGGTNSGGIVSWNLGNVPAGSSGVVRWVARVASYP